MENSKLKSAAVNTTAEAAVVKAASADAAKIKTDDAVAADASKETAAAAKDSDKISNTATEKAADVKTVKADAKTDKANAKSANADDKETEAKDDDLYDEITVVENVEVEEEVEEIDPKTGKKVIKTVKTVKPVKSVKKVLKTQKAPVVEEVREPDSVFIDHGAVLPEFIPGTHLFALIRDPGTLYAYWNSDFESTNGWRLTAFDAQGNVLQSFTSAYRRGGRGYFHVPTILVARVTLEKIEADGSVGMTLESDIKIAAQSQHKQAEKWIDVQDQHIVYEAPSQGAAPNYHEAVDHNERIREAIAGGGKEAMVENAPAGLKPGMNPSSWFGPFKAPGSSDINSGTIGSSDNNFRR